MVHEVNQLVSTLRGGDAIGNTVLRVRDVLRGLGCRSEVYREECEQALRNDTLPAADYVAESGPNKLLIYHYSIGTDLNRLVFHAPDKVMLCYHNVTPPEYFIDIHDHVVGQLYHGRKQLACFAGRCALATGDTEFSRRELEELGFQRTAVLPLALDFEALDRPPDPFIRAAYSDHKVNFLFVGRLAPNKRVEDLIKLYAHYKKYVCHDCRLIVVGDWAGFERYRSRLLRLIAEIDLPDIVMPGRVDFAQLRAFYLLADVYVSMSEHEGFCAPLLEAMHFDVPVLARAAAAVPETMGGAGVLLRELDYAAAAEMLRLLAAPSLLRKRVLEGQRERLRRFKALDYAALLAGLIERANGVGEVGQ